MQERDLRSPAKPGLLKAIWRHEHVQGVFMRFFLFFVFIFFYGKACSIIITGSASSLE